MPPFDPSKVSLDLAPREPVGQALNAKFSSPTNFSLSLDSGDASGEAKKAVWAAVMPTLGSWVEFRRAVVGRVEVWLSQQEQADKPSVQDLFFSLLCAKERKEFQERLYASRTELKALRERVLVSGKAWLGFTVAVSMQEEVINHWFTVLESQMWELVAYPEKGGDAEWTGLERQTLEKLAKMVSVAFGVDTEQG